MLDRITEYRIKPDRGGRWFWHMIAANGEVIGTSGQSFASQADAMRACENAKARAAQAPIRIQDPSAAMNALIRRLASQRAVRRDPQPLLDYMLDARRRAQV
jgi:uncharacterized protein YegP (UPF0339 family)